MSGTVVSDHLGEATLRSHRPCRVQPASAYTGEGIADGLQWLIQVRTACAISLCRSSRVTICVACRAITCCRVMPRRQD